MQAACRELATKIRNLTGEDCANPFVYADLHKCAADCCSHCVLLSSGFLIRFLPATCPEHVAVHIDSDGCLKKGQDNNKECAKRLDFSAWLMAWRRYAIGQSFKHAPGLQIAFDLPFSAAAVLKQMSYKKAVAHEEMVVEVACQAESSGRNRSLGVIFDEVARKHWQEQSGKLGDRFNLEAIVGTRGSDHTMLLERAKDLFDAGKHKARMLAHLWVSLCKPRLKGQANSEQPAKRQAADGQGMLTLALSMNAVV